MPTQAPFEQEYRKRPQLSPQEIAAVVDYVMTRSQGSKSLPQISVFAPDAAALRKGRQIYAENCEQCHAATGRGGGAVGYRNIAPSLMDDSPLEIGEAVREGPDVMPRFGTGIIDDKSLNLLVAYIGYLKTGQYNPGGLQLANIGPVAEGFVAWAFGLGALVLLVRRIGTGE